MQLSNFVNEKLGHLGYNTELNISNDELKTIREFIRTQWLYRIQLLVPKQIKQFDELGMEYYHKSSHLIDHKTAWPETARVLSRKVAAVIRNMDFFKKLENQLGSFQISDEEQLGWENIYWRLVRPGNSDCGSLHADKWFWEVGNYGKVADFPHERLKIWIPIYATAGKNGLLVVPGSHMKQDWKWHKEERYGLNKPILDEPIENLNVELLHLKNGNAVIFHDELIHGGASNLAETTRVSMEFTLLIPNFKK